ncbi:hypothetical protein BD779DRAFT_1525939 [Infundibulicybe gibba]|nr:hypothetical protein BD779DRAFT_1525939 [Infundibulicybe gibba]
MFDDLACILVIGLTHLLFCYHQDATHKPGCQTAPRWLDAKLRFNLPNLVHIPSSRGTEIDLTTYSLRYYVDFRRNPPTSTYQHPLDIYPPPQPHPHPHSASFPTTLSFPAAQNMPFPTGQPNGHTYPYPSGGLGADGGYAPLTSPLMPHTSPLQFGQMPTQPISPIYQTSAMSDMPAPVNNPMSPTYPASPMTEYPQFPVGQAPHPGAWNVSSYPHIG